MNFQRIIPLVIFTVSSFMLWDAWQSHQQQGRLLHPGNPVASLPVSSSGAGSTSINAVPASTVATALPNSSAAPPTGSTVNSSTATPSDGLQQGSRVKVTTDLIEADLDTAGADLRSLKLLKHMSAQQDSKPVDLFEDRSALIYVAQSGLLGPGLPNHTFVFTPDKSSVSLESGQAEATVSFTAIVPGVVRVIKTWHFKRGSYVIGLDTSVENLGTAPLTPQAYFQFLRVSKAPPGDPRFVNTYTGPAVYTESSKFHKESFQDIDKGKTDYPATANNGWIAMLQHYFVAAWLPKNGDQREFFTRKIGNDLYTAGLIEPMETIAPNGVGTLPMSLYAGPQEGKKLQSLAPGLDLTIDYGWLTIIATPLFYVLSMIQGWVGNWGAAIILLTILIKALFFPLSAASYKSMARMRLVQPKMQRIREQYADDKARMNQAMMELYRTEKINPLGGCLPMVVQIPVFIALYWVLLGSVELRHAPFVGWIHDLSAQDPYYILPLIMTASMFVQQRMSPKPPDPIQAKVMMFMPLAFSVMFFFFPAGLVLYWVVNNLLSITQQWQISRMMGDANKH